MKDKEFKDFIKSVFPQHHRINRFNCDFEIEIKSGIYLVFECENSSRGLTSNLVRLARRSVNHRQLYVVFLRTEHHQNKHKIDYENFSFIQSKFEHLDVELINLSDFSKKKSLAEWIKTKYEKTRLLAGFKVLN
jgi:hypothetical protein